MKTMTLTNARNGLLGLAEDLAKSPKEIVQVEKRGRPVMTLMSTELYESLVETLEIISDEQGYASLKRAVKQIERGEGLSMSEVRKRLVVL